MESLLPSDVSHMDSNTATGSAPLASRKAAKIDSVPVATSTQRRRCPPSFRSSDSNCSGVR